MSEFLLTCDITETRALLGTFIQRNEVKPGRTLIRYTIPMPEDGPIGRSDRAEVDFDGRVRKSVRDGGDDSSAIDWPDLLGPVHSIWS